ncbi:MAG TPA: hypothetical protein VMX75_02915, partial [Spirochaetia bacterium]|nr:hypothetical protein [Spirochaetia bacterium]
TLAATALMEVVFARDAADLDTASILSRHVEWEEREREIRETFAAIPSVEDVVTTCREKHLTGQKLEERIELIRANWETMRREVSRQMLPYAELKELLMRAACPVEPGQINLTRKRVMETFFSAQMIRNRYTILDLAFDLGWLSECVREISNSKTYL